MIEFFSGVLSIIIILVIAVYVRRFIKARKIKEYIKKGGNSRESVGESIVAILNSNKTVK